jgi:hypothetical protein
MSPAHRQPDFDDEATAPLYRPRHRPEPNLALHVDIPTGCPLDVEINSYGEVGVSLGTTATCLHLNFEPPALRQLVERARPALGP